MIILKAVILMIFCLKNIHGDFNDNYGEDEEETTTTPVFDPTTQSTTITDKPEYAAGICHVRLRTPRFQRITHIRTSQKTYLAECCGGLKMCHRAKKLFTYKGMYKTINVTEDFQVCCEGYERDQENPFLPTGNIKCRPICDPPCIRGQCRAPGRCTCDFGFKINRNKRYECIEACKSPCTNARCIAPYTCECDPGYTSMDGEYCAPICAGGCENGTCILPGTCRCNDGFYRDPVDPYVCKPMCSKGCGENGTCIEPETCKCQDGEMFNKHTKLCGPECPRDCGDGGRCVPEPVKCDCKTGYVYNATYEKCRPICTKPCHGGVCVGPDQCQCEKYYFQENGYCKPLCDKPCRFGLCTKRNFCTCFEYYRPQDNNTRCEPHCDNCASRKGVCLAPRVCRCPKGLAYLYPDGKSKGDDVTRKACIPPKTGYGPSLKKCLDRYDQTKKI